MPKPSLDIGGLRAFAEGEVGLAVLGFPIAHSISPQLHNAALKKMSEVNPRYAHWYYHKIEVPPNKLAETLPQLAEMGYRGINLTIPHKVDVLPMLDLIDDEAKAMGAVNTLLWNGKGWTGRNTDGYGLERGVSGDLGVSLSSSEVLVLGAGGAARAAVAKCLLDGCVKVRVANRSLPRLMEMSKTLNDEFGEDRVHPFTLSGIPPELRESNNLLVINATSVGLKKNDPAPLSLAELSPKTKVYDMVYNPPETALLTEARKAGMTYGNGLSMLVYQAARALEIWTGEPVPSKVMLKEAKIAMEVVS